MHFVKRITPTSILLITSKQHICCRKPLVVLFSLEHKPICSKRMRRLATVRVDYALGGRYNIRKSDVTTQLDRLNLSLSDSTARHIGFSKNFSMFKSS